MFLRRHREAQPEHVGDSEPARLLFDDASGLYQSWYFERRAEEEVARSSRYSHPFIIILWQPRLLPDETLPDEVIAKVGLVVSQGIRKTDLAARLEDSQFAALLVEAGYAIARSVAHRVKLDLGQRARTEAGASAWRTGFALFPDDGLEFDALFQVARRRLADDVSAAA